MALHFEPSFEKEPARFETFIYHLFLFVFIYTTGPLGW